MLFVTLGKKLCILQTDHRECTNVCLELWTTDPSVCPLHTSCPILQCPKCSGPGGRRPPGQRWPRAARRTVGGRRRLERSVSRRRGLGFARVTSISPRTTVTPLILYPAALQWSERAERVSIQQTNKENSGSMVYFFSMTRSAIGD